MLWFGTRSIDNDFYWDIKPLFTPDTGLDYLIDHTESIPVRERSHFIVCSTLDVVERVDELEKYIWRTTLPKSVSLVVQDAASHYYFTEHIRRFKDYESRLLAVGLEQRLILLLLYLLNNKNTMKPSVRTGMFEELDILASDYKNFYIKDD